MQKELIFIGLGKMGQAMTAHLVEEGYVVHGFDTNLQARIETEAYGVQTYQSTIAALTAMPARKIVWIMVPSQFVDAVLTEVYTQCKPGDIIIDGGNSFYQDTITRAQAAAELGFHYLDCGTSGGVNGARTGASLMVGGPASVVTEVEHIFHTLATPNGYGHVGASGAGHFVKMVHNGIEYGMMGAIAEGISFIEEHKELAINTTEILKPYQNGSVISSSLMNWLAQAYTSPAYLESIAGVVPKGETEAEMEYIATGNKTPVLQAALQQRKDTRINPSRTGTLISAMRNMFGGHKTIEK